MQKIWSFFSSIRLTLYLTYAITIDVVAGSLVLIVNRDTYTGIDRMVLADWWLNTGSLHLGVTWWIPILVFLVFIFAINTMVCSIDRLIPICRFYFRERIEKVTIGGKDMEEEDPTLFNKRKSLTPFYPYIAHIGFLIALIGHLIGSTGGFKSYGNVIAEGSILEVPNNRGLYLLLDRFDVRMHRSGYPEEMKSYVRLLEENKVVAEKVVEVNSPFIYKGLAFYASDFQQAPDGRFYVAFDVIKDPGVWVLFTGLFIFTVGILLTLFLKRDWAELTKRA
jgi:cytochrome c biogenesis protein ResB